MIKLKNILTENYVYHITPKKNISNIKTNGIVPKPEKIAPFNREVYLFPDITTTEDALMNWLEDKFPENEPLVMLTINTAGLDLHPSNVGYEIVSHKIIPWKNIIKIEDV